MKDLENLIRRAKAEDTGAMIELIDTFSPLIGKYTRFMDYDEDFRSDMILKLIIVIKNEMDLDAFRVVNDYTILKYLKIALHRHYIMLSKRKKRLEDNETTYEFDELVDMIDNRDSFVETLYDGIRLEQLRDILTQREYDCIESIVFKGFTATQVAQKLGVTKQAVNQCKKRALSKIRQRIT